MSDYEIFVDSTTDLPAEHADKLRLNVIPYIFELDGKEYFNYLDYREISVKDFYDTLRGGKLGKTTQVTPHRYVEAWKPALEAGKDVLYMCLSSQLSKSYEQSLMAVQEAKEAYPDRKIISIDTKSACLGQGILATLSAKQRDAGKTLEENAAYIEATIPNVQHWVVADDLHHLKRGGRISAAKAVMGTFLNVKPVLIVSDTGKLAPVEKARGTKKAIAMLVDKLTEHNYNGEEIYIGHGDSPETAEQLKAAIIEKFGEKEILISPIGPVIGSHAGPGTITFMFVGGERIKL